MANRTVRNIMRSVDICLKPDMTLDKVSDHLEKHHLPGAPVADDDLNLIGFVSEYDCIKQLVQSSYYCDNTAMVKDVMSTKLIKIDPNITVIDIAVQMNNNKINVAPVIENDKIIGVISRGDIMRELVNDLENCRIAI